MGESTESTREQPQGGLPEARSSHTEKVTKGRLLGRLIVGQTVAVGFLTIMTATGGLLAPGSGLFGLVPLGGIAVVVGLASLWLLRRGGYRAGSYVFLVGTAVAITSNVYVRGYQDASAIYYLWPILCAVLLLETRGAVVVTAVSSVLYGTLVVLQVMGVQVPPLPYDPATESLLTVGSRLMMFFLLAFLGWLTSRDLRSALEQATDSSERLQALNATLEERIEARTNDLQLRASYLEATAAVAAEAGRLLGDSQLLLERVVQLVSDRLGSAHAGLFLVDSTGEWAELVAASSKGGRRMLARGHRLRVGVQGLVGYAASSGQPRVALDVGSDVLFADNPDLPDTRSELALPLRVGGRVIGVLDVQSPQAGAFSDQDVSGLQSLADQVAVAVDNAHLHGQLERSLETEQRTRGALTGQAWQQYLRTQADLGFTKEGDTVLRAGSTLGPEMHAAAETGRAVSGNTGVLAVPVRVGDQVVAVIDARLPSDEDDWTADRVSLLQALADQVGQALDRARLYETTQLGAARERLLSETTSRIRESLDLDTVLQVAAREVSQALDLGMVEVRLGSGPRAQAGEQVP